MTYSNQGTDAEAKASLEAALAAVRAQWPQEDPIDLEYAVRDIFANDVLCTQEELFVIVKTEYLIDYH